MSAIYSLADEPTAELLQKLIHLYHRDLHTTEATFDLVFAVRDPKDTSEAPTLSVQGHRVNGISKIHGLKERVLGLADAEIVLDGDAWPVLSIASREALLDHQLQFFEVKRSKEGEFVFDDLERPVLKLRKTDRSFQWFDVVAERHAEHSLEISELRTLISESGQIYLRFIESADAQESMIVSVNGAPPVPMCKSKLMASIQSRFES